MFTRQTTLILGAGASQQDAYSTDEKLIDKIINAIEVDKLYIPYLKGLLFLF